MSPDKSGQSSPLDDTDRRIVHLLQQDGRMSMRDLAAAVHVSRAHVYTRVKRLLDDGVIRRFTIQVDPERVGFSTSAYLTMKVEQNSWRQIRDGLAALPWVEHVALVSGDFDVLLLVRSASNRTLRDLVFTHIQSMPGVRSTRTLLVFDETDHLPALPGDPETAPGPGSVGEAGDEPPATGVVRRVSAD